MIKYRLGSVDRTPLVSIRLPCPSNVPVRFVLQITGGVKLVVESKVHPPAGTPFVAVKTRFVPALVTVLMTGDGVSVSRVKPEIWGLLSFPPEPPPSWMTAFAFVAVKI